MNPTKEQTIYIARPPRTPRGGQKSPRGGVSGQVFTSPLADFLPRKPHTRLYPRTREVALLIRGRGDYRVDLDRIPDAPALVGWIEHLAHKTWVKREHLLELIAHAERENGVCVDRGA